MGTGLDGLARALRSHGEPGANQQLALVLHSGTEGQLVRSLRISQRPTARQNIRSRMMPGMITTNQGIKAATKRITWATASVKSVPSRSSARALILR
jgi:hypothetical protein